MNDGSVVVSRIQSGSHSVVQLLGQLPEDTCHLEVTISPPDPIAALNQSPASFGLKAGLVLGRFGPKVHESTGLPAILLLVKGRIECESVDMVVRIRDTNRLYASSQAHLWKPRLPRAVRQRTFLYSPDFLRYNNSENLLGSKALAWNAPLQRMWLLRAKIGVPPFGRSFA